LAPIVADPLPEPVALAPIVKKKPIKIPIKIPIKAKIPVIA